jgi:hypothetical protein
MVSPTSSATPNGQQSRGYWPAIAPYAVPIIAASAAIVPAFRDLAAKSAQQMGQSVPTLSSRELLKGGVKLAPTVGGIIGMQMVLQGIVQRALYKEGEKASFSAMVASSACVASVSAPFIAIFNGKTMGWSEAKTIQKFTRQQGLVIVVQETAFVLGISAADRLADIMKSKLGDNRLVEYSAAFTAGALGSLAGHPANTVLTRLQNELPLGGFRQSFWGAAHRARAIGIFSVSYKLGKELLNFTVEDSYRFCSWPIFQKRGP